MDPIQLPDISGIADMQAADLAALQQQLRDNLTAIFEVDDSEVTTDLVQNAKDHQAALDQVNARIGELQAVEDDFRSMREQHQAEAEAPAEETQPETVVDEVVEVEPEPVENAQVEQAAQPVAASTVRRTVASNSSRPAAPAPRKDEPESPKAKIYVAPDVSGYAASSELPTTKDLAKAFASRVTGFHVGAQGRHKAGVASIAKPFSDDLVVTNKASDEVFWETVQHAGNEKRLPGGSLTAAGWCAPSETLYDLCPGSSTEGLYELPEIQIRRGGVRFTNGPDYAALYDPSFGWDFTEAEVIAGVTKTFVEVDCPEWEDLRLDAVGFGVVSPILTKAAFPELVEQFAQEALIAHQHRISAKVLNHVVTAAGAAIETGNLGSIAGGALAAVELIAERERSIRRWPMSETLEVTAPHWFRSALRADYSMRTGVDLQAVSDQTIASYFSARNLRIQYVYGWQALAANADVYPATVQLLVQRAGSFVKGTSDVINVSAVYDSTLLAENKYIEMFFEEGVLVLQRCYGAHLVEVPVCVAGVTGAPINEACMAAAVTP